MRKSTEVACTVIATLGLVWTTACSSPPELPGQGDDLDKTVVYRDTWGVAHIYAPTVERGLYAQGWAQAEDRPDQLLMNFMMAIGEFASVVGPDGVPVDLRSRMWNHYGVAKRGFGEIRPEIQRHLRAFADGINDFYGAHPEDVPEWWGDRQVDGEMIIAFSRLFLYNWSIDEAYGDLGRGGTRPGISKTERGSNQFAVSSERSAEGAAILAIDPHLSWQGPSRFWELRVHAGEWQGSGVTLPGSPYIGLGHTRNLAWAMTTGGPDTADVYRLALRDGDPSQYLFDGDWRDLTSRIEKIEVRGEDPRVEELWFSHHGPIIASDGVEAYAASVAYAGVASLNEAWWELNFGADYEGAVRAMETQTMFPQNVMVADTSGNIYYQRTGRVPVRPKGQDWSQPVDGSTSATAWQGVHPASDHLQVLNPAQGYMQNCNIPPDAMMPGSPFKLEETLPYLFSSRDYGPLEGWTNQRGARAIELLSADDSVTVEEAMAYVNDVSPYGARRWIEALQLAFSESPSAAGLDALTFWDGRLAADSRSGRVYEAWRRQLIEELGRAGLAALSVSIDDWYAPIRGEDERPLELDEEQSEQLVGAFERAMARLTAEDPEGVSTYGDRHRVGAGDRSWPLGGGGGRIGTTTLRNISYGAKRDDGTVWGRAGQTSTQIVVMTDPPQSWGYVPIGQSDRPASPHFADQAESLFSPRTLKPSWWLPEDLVGHIESRTELAGAGGPST